MPHDVKIRVRYAETDQMGVVYHSNYLVYFEIGRTETMRHLGISYADLEARGYVLAVIESQMRHMGSARYDDELIVRTWLREVTKTRLRFEYHVLRGESLLASERHPTARFVGERFDFEGDRVSAVAGTLTLRGRTQPLTLRATRFACYANPLFQREVCGGDFEAPLRHRDFGIAAPAGVPEEVRLVVQVEAIRQ